MKKKRWQIAAFAAAVMMCLSCASCSAASEPSKSSYDGSYAVSENGFYEDAEYYDENYSVAETAKTGSADSSAAAAEFEDKIIRTANVDMESDDAQKCYDTLLAFVKQNGGSELNVRKSHDSYGSYGYYNIEATLKIAPDKLEDFIKLAEETDKVTSSQITADDVTQEYYDIKLRLDSKKAALKKYYKLLDEAQNVEESLEVQRYITDLTAEIESMEGMLRYYDEKVDLSTVNLTISQRDKLPAEIDDEFHWDSLSLSDVGKLMKNGFLGMLNFLWSLLLWILIAAVVLSPVALIALAVFFIGRHFLKKRPKVSKASKAENGQK